MGQAIVEWIHVILFLTTVGETVQIPQGSYMFNITHEQCKALESEYVPGTLDKDGDLVLYSKCGQRKSIKMPDGIGPKSMPL